MKTHTQKYVENQWNINWLWKFQYNQQNSTNTDKEERKEDTYYPYQEWNMISPQPQQTSKNKEILQTTSLQTARLVKNLPTMQETLVRFLGGEDPPEKGQATHSSILGLSLWLSWYRIFLECRRAGYDAWVGKIPWKSKWLPTPVFWPGECHRVTNSWTWSSNFHFTLKKVKWKLNKIFYLTQVILNNFLNMYSNFKKLLRIWFWFSGFYRKFEI